MDTNDRQLLNDLSVELQRAQPVRAKDAEAEAYIAQHIASQPDSTYLLTQAVLLQQQALRNAQMQIQQLQQQQGRGGILGGLFGGQQPARRPYSPGYSRPGYSQYGSPARGQASSFLGQAATTAAGVAGGMLLFDGLENLFDGGIGDATEAFGDGGNWDML